MDDSIKIKVLMIYYDHWGKKEIRARKAVDGLNRTMFLLSERFHTDDDTEYTLDTGLIRLFHYMSDDELPYLWTEFVDIFLADCGGCFEPVLVGDPYDEEEMLFDRKIMLEDHLNITNDETSDIIYDNDFGYEDALSVDAIVALF